jgi:hypothetical protein
MNVEYWKNKSVIFGDFPQLWNKMLTQCWGCIAGTILTVVCMCPSFYHSETENCYCLAMVAQSFHMLAHAVFFYFFFFLETRFHHAVQAVLEFLILLPQHPEWWDKTPTRCVHPCSVWHLDFYILIGLITQMKHT